MRLADTGIRAKLRAHRHLERQFDQAAARFRGDLAGRAQARHRLPARDQMRRRRVSARAVRSARLQCRRARAKDLQRRRHAVEISVRRSQQRPARRRSGRPCPLHRSGRLYGARRAAHRQHLSAQRQSAGDRQIHLQDRLDEAAFRLCARTLARWKSHSSWPATTT